MTTLPVPDKTEKQHGKSQESETLEDRSSIEVDEVMVFGFIRLEQSGSPHVSDNLPSLAQAEDLMAELTK